jgi:hypothetical protein
MPRANLDTTLAADMASPNFCPVILASLAFRSQTANYWNGRGSLVWNSMTFEGIGTLGKIGSIGTGSAEVTESGTTVEASGLDSTLLGETLTDIQIGAPVSLWLGSWVNGAIHGTPYLLWQGGMGQPMVTPDPQQFSIVLALQTRMAQLSRATCRRYTAADQRLFYPDDSSMNWVEIDNDIALIWGAAS